MSSRQSAICAAVGKCAKLFRGPSTRLFTIGGSSAGLPFIGTPRPFRMRKFAHLISLSVRHGFSFGLLFLDMVHPFCRAWSRPRRHGCEAATARTFGGDQSAVPEFEI